MSKEERINVWKDTLNKANSYFEDECSSFLVEGDVEPITQFDPITEIEVINQDCVEAVQDLHDCGYSTCLLNFASAKQPGGGVLTGASAQEEDLCRRSDLFLHLVGFSDLARNFDIIPRDQIYGTYTGWIIYSPQVYFFKDKNYKYLSNEIETDVISCAALNRKYSEPKNGWKKETKRRMRNILRIAYRNGRDALILGAWGCGAFKNPPEEIAKWWHEVIDEIEFHNRFKKIVFAILNDNNSVSNNYEVFKKEFE